MVNGLGPALGGPGSYRFLNNVDSGPCIRSYNVPNDRIIVTGAGRVQDKRQVAQTFRRWLLVSLQSAQGAAGALVAVCGSQHSRP